MQIELIISWLGLVGGLGGFLFGIFQYWTRKKIEKFNSRFLLMEKFFSATGMWKMFQRIDHCENLGVDRGDFRGSEDEKNLDQLVIFLDHVLRCKNEKMIDDKGFQSFEYFFNRLRSHKCVRKYLEEHKNETLKLADTEISPFQMILNEFNIRKISRTSSAEKQAA